MEDKLIGFQSKYYSDSVTMSDKENELIRAVRGAARSYPGITTLYFYISREFSPSSKKDIVVPSYQTNVEKVAEDTGIKIVWRGISNIEAQLMQDSRLTICRNVFFQPDSTVQKCCESLDKHKKDIFEGINTNMKYKEHTIVLEHNMLKIDEFLNSDNQILIVDGDAGSGKSALIKQALMNLNSETAFLAFKSTDMDVNDKLGFLALYGMLTIDEVLDVYKEADIRILYIDAVEKYFVMKKYLSELIAESYMDWGRKKVILTAPTGMGLEMIFMSATMTEVRQLLVQTIKNCWTKLSRGPDGWRMKEEYKEIIPLDYSMYSDFSRFHCICIPDEDTLCDMLVKSSGKSIVFIDSKERGAAFKEKMVKKGGIDSRQIAVLNADNLDEQYNSEMIRTLAIGHVLMPKILITTTVLDNGVSIHDPDVENLYVLTESKISFLQMLGRVRAEKIKTCKLYFLRREADIFLKRMNQYQVKLEDFQRLEQDDIKSKLRFYTNLVWDNTDKKVDFYRQSLVLIKHEYQFFDLPAGKVQWVYGDEGLYINGFAKGKTGDMYIAESRFYSQAVSDPLEVIYTQMAWMEKEPEELEVVKSKYFEELERTLKEDLLTVQRYNNKQFQEVKKSICSKYGKTILKNTLMKSGTISKEKLLEIVEKLDLLYDDTETDDKGRKLYTIKERQR